MANFNELQSRLFLDIQAMRCKCILYLRNTLLQTENKILLTTDNQISLKRAYIEPIFGTGFEFVIGYNVYSIFMDANEVAIKVYNPNDINTEANAFTKTLWIYLTFVRR